MDEKRMAVVVRVRLTHDQHAELVRQSKASGLNFSELVRHRIFNKKIVASADKDAAKSIDQIGRMLKSLYPKDKGWASAEDRQKWWRMADDLREIARDIRCGYGRIEL